MFVHSLILAILLGLDIVSYIVAHGEVFVQTFTRICRSLILKY